MQYRKTVCTVTALACVLIGTTAHAAKANLTSHRTMMNRLASIEIAGDVLGLGRVRVTPIGKSVQGRDIPMVLVHDPAVPVESTKRMFIICRQHGDEPASTEGMLSLIANLAFDPKPETADLLSKVSFYIVPMANPDGADRFQRRNANATDLNRDWLSLSQPETKCIRAAYDSVLPEVVIDGHELSPGNRTTDFVQSAGPACGALPEVAEESARIQRLVIGILRTHDMTVRSCEIDDRNPARLAHRYFPIHAGTKTFLFETRQSGERVYQLQHRMEHHIVGTMTIAKYLAGQEDELAARIARWETGRRNLMLASRSKPKTRPALPGRKK